MKEKDVRQYVETIHITPRYLNHRREIVETDELDPTKHDFYKDHGCIGFRFFKAFFDDKIKCFIEDGGNSHWVFFQERLDAAMKLMGWNPGIATDDEIIPAVEKES